MPLVGRSSLVSRSIRDPITPTILCSYASTHHRLRPPPRTYATCSANAPVSHSSASSVAAFISYPPHFFPAPLPASSTHIRTPSTRPKPPSTRPLFPASACPEDLALRGTIFRCACSHRRSRPLPDHQSRHPAHLRHQLIGTSRYP